MYHIQIVGAGYTGSRIAFDFMAKKQKVWAVTRTVERHPEFTQAGITPLAADLTQPETLEKLPPAHFIVICPSPETRTPADYRKIYLEGVGNYLRALKAKSRPSLILYLSSTGVWRDRQGEWMDESMPPDADHERGKILAQAEEQVLASGFPAVVFRLAGIYGPERNRLAAFKAGKWPQSRENGWMNLIHVEDIVRAVPVLFKSAKTGEIYTGVDDGPVLKSDFAAFLAEKTGVKPAFAMDDGRSGKRCSNQKLKSLGFQSLYPTFREGYSKL